MKKWLVLMMSISMILGMTACQGKSTGSGGQEPAATTEAKVSNKDLAYEAADNFMKCLSEGDIDNIGNYCTEEAMTKMQLNDLEKSFTDSFNGMTGDNGEQYTPSEEAMASIRGGVSIIIKACIDKYELGQAEGEEGQTSYDVPVTVYTREPNDSSNLDMNTVMGEAMTEETLTEMMKIAQEQGQNAMYDYMMVSIMPKVFESMGTAIESVESKPTESKLVVAQQEDGSWKVTDAGDVSVGMPGNGEEGTDAAAASTQQ